MPILPQVRVFQELDQTPTEVIRPLRAFVFGPEYELHRYTVSDEKEKAGDYSSLNGNTFKWLDDLGRRAGATVDQSYTKVYLENALLEYFNDSVGSGDTINTPDDVANKITFSNTNLVDKDSYSLDSDLHGRDVQVGDRVKVNATVSGTTYTKWADIIDLEAEDTSASVNSATADSDNQSSTSASSPSVTVQEDPDGNSFSLDVTGTYNGLADGVLDETYTVTVRKGSSNQDPSTMILDIESQSGEDDVIGFVPSATDFTTDIPLGNNGLNFQFDDGGTAPGTDIVEDYQWTVDVTQAYSLPNFSASGSYTGDKDTTYIVTVEKGGDADGGTDPVVSISTTTGYDSSGNVTVSDANAFAVGNYGVQISFDTGSNPPTLVTGDRFYIPVEAAGKGAARTIVLNRSLQSELVSTSGNSVDLEVTLYIKKDLELPQELPLQGITNWTQDGTEITLNSTAEAFDSSWRDGDHSLPVADGEIYVHWREMVTDRSDKIYSAKTLSELKSTVDTKIDPDNPLVYGCQKALQNSNGNGIRFMALPETGSSGWTKILSQAETREDLYTLVPLTFDTDIWDLVDTHVENQSTPEQAQWRSAIFSIKKQDPAPIVEEDSDGIPALATIDSNGYVDLEDGSSVEFLADGVKAGDTLRYNYAEDKVGNETYDELTVDQVLTEDRLQLTQAPSSSINQDSKFEIWRDLDASEVVDQVTNSVSNYTSRRITALYPGEVEAGGNTVPGYYLAAAIAGLRGGVKPHQGLTNVEISGFDSVDLVKNVFTRSQLNDMSDGGVWIVTQNDDGSTIYTRHAVTTDLSSLETQEEMVTRNLDSVSYYMHGKLAPFIGRANVTPSFTEVLRTQIVGGLQFLRSSGDDELTGGQIIEGDIVTLRPHAQLKDRYVIDIDLTLPFPNNNNDLTLVI